MTSSDDGFCEASQMLASALQQIDTIISGNVNFFRTFSLKKIETHECFFLSFNERPILYMYL